MPERVLGLGLLSPAIPALPDFIGWQRIVADVGTFVGQRYLLAVPVLNRAVVRLLFRPMLAAPLSREKLQSLLGSDPPGSLFDQSEAFLRAADDAFRHSLKWCAHGQPALAELALRPELHYDIAAVGKALAGVPVRVWSGANDTVIVGANHKYAVESLTRGGHKSVESRFVPNEVRALCMRAYMRAVSVWCVCVCC